MLYWTNFIMKSYDDGKPWLCASYDGCLTLDEAIRNIEKQRKNYIVLSAWIDIFENNEKKTIFHECYLDAIGNVAKLDDLNQ